MPWAGGSFSLSQDFLADAAAGPPDSFITAAKMDNVLEDIGDGLEACFNRNGDNAAAANLSMGSFRLTTLGAATVATDAVRARQVAENSLQFGGTTGGSSNAYTVTNAFFVAAATGTRLLLRANHTNSGAATLNINGGGAVAIRDLDDVALASGIIESGKFFEVIYDQTTSRWHLGTPLSLSAIGSALQAWSANLDVWATKAESDYYTVAEADAEIAEVAADVEALEATVGALQPFPVGVVFDYTGATEPTGWLFLSGKTIGSASSGGTARANADTANLFAHLWNSFANAELPIQDSSGVASTRGANAAADFAANKRMPLPDAQGRVIAGKDNMSGTSANRLTDQAGGVNGDVLGDTGGNEKHELTEAELAEHDHDDTFGVSIANGTLVVRATLGIFTGSVTEAGTDMLRAAGMATATISGSITGAVSNAGSGDPHNNVQPTLVLNKIIFYAG